MTDEVTKKRILVLIREIYKTEKRGGMAHNVLHDGYVDNSSIQWCLDYNKRLNCITTQQLTDKDHINYCLTLMLTLTEDERDEIIKQWDKERGVV